MLCPASARGAQNRQSAEKSAVNAKEVYFMFLSSRRVLFDPLREFLRRVKIRQDNKNLLGVWRVVNVVTDSIYRGLIDVLTRMQSHRTQVDYGQLTGIMSGADS
jgi:hypothetical protein